MLFNVLSSSSWYFGIWLAIFVIALIIEALEPGLISIWFAGGALVAFILSLIPSIELWVQIVVFIVTSGILLLISFLFLRKSFLNSRYAKTNSDAILDQEVILLTPCDKDVLGEVIYRDVVWKATPKNRDDVFVKNEEAIVDTIAGNKLVIKKKGNN